MKNLENPRFYMITDERRIWQTELLRKSSVCQILQVQKYYVESIFSRFFTLFLDRYKM